MVALDLRAPILGLFGIGKDRVDVSCMELPTVVANLPYHPCIARAILPLPSSSHRKCVWCTLTRAKLLYEDDYDNSNLHTYGQLMCILLAHLSAQVSSPQLSPRIP